MMVWVFISVVSVVDHSTWTSKCASEQCIRWQVLRRHLSISDVLLIIFDFRCDMNLCPLLDALVYCCIQLLYSFSKLGGKIGLCWSDIQASRFWFPLRAGLRQAYLDCNTSSRILSPSLASTLRIDSWLSEQSCFVHSWPIMLEST